MLKDFTISNLLDLNETIAGELFEGKTYPWEVLPKIKDFIVELGNTLDVSVYEKRGENIWVAKSAKVAETAFLNGPLIIDEGAEVRHCAFIRGNAIVGKNCVVGNSTELKNVILFNSVQVPHYNYVGDSILGHKSHMGAGSITSNVKSDKTLVVVKDGKEVLLSALEYRLLLVFVNNRGNVMSRNRLLEEIWDVAGDFVNDNTLTVYIKRLREKIEENPSDPQIIKTIRGLGYRLD